jgi:molecular chaperone DnaK (HSP70)
MRAGAPSARGLSARLSATVLVFSIGWATGLCLGRGRRTERQEPNFKQPDPNLMVFEKTHFSLFSPTSRSSSTCHQPQPSNPSQINMSTASRKRRSASSLLLLAVSPASSLLPSLPTRDVHRRIHNLLTDERISTISHPSRSPLFNAANDEEAHLQGISVGIDLGTTNSAVAMMIPSDDEGDKTKPAMIDIAAGKTTMPSVVSFVPADPSAINDMTKALYTASATTSTETMIDIQWPTSHQIITGNDAIHFEQLHPQMSYRNVKRIIGTGGKMASLAMRVVPNLFIASSLLEDTKPSSKTTGKKSKWKQKKQNELPKIHKQLEDAVQDPALLTFRDTANNQSIMLRPEQISACILRQLYDVAECYHQTMNQGEKVSVTRAVIGVPAYFTEEQKKATIRASELAGVSKVKLLPEPEAAALAYGVAANKKDSMKEELILVFDLGGGTFDVSVLEVGGGLTEVLATVGNNRLGGTDFDKRVAEYLSKQAVQYARNAKVEGAVQRLVIKDLYKSGSGGVSDIILRVAEEARKRLSNQKIVEVLVPLTEEGWKKVGGGDLQEKGEIMNVIGPFDSSMIQNEYDMTEGEDYIVVSIDRKIFEQICVNELQLLLQPIREVAIMAGVLLQGEARPSFVENALAMARDVEDDARGEDFWDLDDDDDVLMKTSKGGIEEVSAEETEQEEALTEQALQQIDVMNLKARKKEQQRGRKKAREISKRERSFRKEKQSAAEDATANLLGVKKKKGDASTQSTAVTTGNAKVQEGIHGRPLSRIVLVGGATRMPVVAKLLEAVVGIVPQRTVNPDEAVAIGCAIQCGILDGDNDGLLGGMQAVLSPMQAAVMRALAKKRGMDEIDEDDEEWDSEFFGVEQEFMMMGGGRLGGISGLAGGQIDDEI